MTRRLCAVLAIGLLWGATSCTGTASPRPTSRPRPLSPVQRLRKERVLIIGDSLMVASRPHLRRRLGALRVVNNVTAQNGSGLVNSYGMWNWHYEADRLQREFRPTIVVAEFCCNYWEPYPTDASGQPIAPGTSAFSALWASRARILARELTRGGARLFWVITPPTANEALNRNLIGPINAVTRSMASRRDPPIHLIDWVTPITGHTGRFVPTLEIEGRTVTVRKFDGLHFTPAGGRLAANAIVDALLADARTTRQPRPGASSGR